MALSLYDPRTQSFRTFTAPVADLPFDQMLLLNILIECKLQTHYLQLLAAPTDEIVNIRADIVSVT